MTERRPVLYQVPADLMVRRCGKCPQLIAFVETPKGAHMPVNVEDANAYAIEVVNDTIVRWRVRVAFAGESHYGTCPEARQFGKKKAASAASERPEPRPSASVSAAPPPTLDSDRATGEWWRRLMWGVALSRLAQSGR